MKRTALTSLSTLATLTLATLTLATPAWAEDRFELAGQSRGAELQATLLLEDSGQTTIQVRGASGAINLSGALSERSASWTGILRADQGFTGALTPGYRADRWNARLHRDGPVVSLRLASGYRSIELAGVAELGQRDLANEALIRRFYSAFSRKDGEAMASCYPAAGVHFSDPVFPNLRGRDAGDMWRMLCESEELVVVFSGIRADARYGYAHWEADYELFGNKIHNVIEARFEFRDGQIVRHVDQFDFKTWSSQAFTKAIRLLPSTAVRHVVRRISAKQLSDFQAKRDAE